MFNTVTDANLIIKKSQDLGEEQISGGLLSEEYAQSADILKECSLYNRRASRASERAMNRLRKVPVSLLCVG